MARLICAPSFIRDAAMNELAVVFSYRIIDDPLWIIDDLLRHPPLLHLLSPMYICMQYAHFRTPTSSGSSVCVFLKIYFGMGGPLVVSDIRCFFWDGLDLCFVRREEADVSSWTFVLSVDFRCKY